MNDKLYQLKITLLNVDPPIWRRFVVPPDIYLEELHEIIQDVMGWKAEHLHSFVVGKTRSNRKSYLPAEGCVGPNDIPEEDYVLKDLAHRAGMKILYWYDFGDDWKHEIVVEKTAYSDPKHPGEIRCLDGKGACPPENCGGPYIYSDTLQDWQDGEELDTFFSFLGAMLSSGRFDPERFDIDKARKNLQTTLKRMGWMPTDKAAQAADAQEEQSVIHPVEIPPKEIVLPALLSPIEAVRIFAGVWFAWNGDDLDATKNILKSVQKYGIENSLLILDELCRKQDEETIAWIVGELDKDHDLQNIANDNYCWFLAQMLCNTYPELLSENMVELRCFPEKLKEAFLFRLELAKLSWDQLYDLLKLRLRGKEDACPYNPDQLTEAMARHVDRKTEVLDTLFGRNDYLKRLKNQDCFSEAEVSDFILVLLELTANWRAKGALPILLSLFGVPLGDFQKKPKQKFKIDVYDNRYALAYFLSQVIDDRTLERLYHLWTEKPRYYEWFPDMLRNVNTPMGDGVALAMLKSETLEDHDAKELARYLLTRCVEEVYPLIPKLYRKLEEEVMYPEESNLCLCFVVAKIIYPGKRTDPDQDTCYETWRYRLEDNQWGYDSFHEQMLTERQREKKDDEDSFFC